MAAGDVHPKLLEQALLDARGEADNFGDLVLEIRGVDGASAAQREGRGLKHLVVHSQTKNRIDQSGGARIQELAIFEAAVYGKAKLVAGAPVDPRLNLLVSHVRAVGERRVAAAGTHG